MWLFLSRLCQILPAGRIECLLLTLNPYCVFSDHCVGRLWPHGPQVIHGRCSDPIGRFRAHQHGHWLVQTVSPHLVGGSDVSSFEQKSSWRSNRQIKCSLITAPRCPLHASRCVPWEGWAQEHAAVFLLPKEKRGNGETREPSIWVRASLMSDRQTDRRLRGPKLDSMWDRRRQITLKQESNVNRRDLFGMERHQPLADLFPFQMENSVIFQSFGCL